MFNSPLHYCPKCKEYVELDQSKAQCAALHGCDGKDCPLEQIFRPPPAAGDEGATAKPKPTDQK